MTKIRDVVVNVGGAELLTPTGMFLLAANTIFTTDYEVTAAQVQNARSLMGGIIAAAWQARCRQTEKLRRLLRTDRTSGLTLKMAQRACDMIPAAEMNKLLMKSHRDAEAGAPLYSQHGQIGAFVGAGDEVVPVDVLAGEKIDLQSIPTA